MSPESVVLLKTYDPAEYESLQTVNTGEVMRYGGMMVSRTPVAKSEFADPAVILALIDECAKEAEKVISYKACYRHVRITWDGDMPVLPFDIHGSKNLAHNLSGCDRAVMFAATIGVGFDRLIAKYNRISPSKALIFQALGAERVEALCDLLNADMSAEYETEGYKLKPRFSPGYGDLPLEVQTEFMTLLDCAHLTGINLNESMIMSPSKSVTAVIGAYKDTGS